MRIAVIGARAVGGYFGAKLSEADADVNLLAHDTVARVLAFAGTLPVGAYSSLHDDMVSGRRTELEALHGHVVRRAPRSRFVRARLRGGLRHSPPGRAQYQREGSVRRC
jgi:ketopantoate reductase